MTGAFSRFANIVARASGKPSAFAAGCIVVLIWAITGPIFHYSDTWQLVINTGTTIITFLMVFLIQNTQNRDGAALQAKLDELIHATEDARNKLIGSEKLPEKELQEIREEFRADATPSFSVAPLRSQAPPPDIRST